MNIIRFIKLVVVGIIINIAIGEIYLSGFLKFLEWRRVSAAVDSRRFMKSCLIDTVIVRLDYIDCFSSSRLFCRLGRIRSFWSCSCSCYFHHVE